MLPNKFYREWGRALYLVENTGTYTFMLILLIWMPPTIVLTTIGFGDTVHRVLALNPDTWYYVWTYFSHGFYHESVIVLSVVVTMLYYLYPLETLIGEVRYYRVVSGSLIIAAITHLIISFVFQTSDPLSGGLPLVTGLIGAYAGCLPFEKARVFRVDLPFISIPIMMIGLLLVSTVINGVMLFDVSQVVLIITTIFGCLYGYYLQANNELEFDDEYLPDEVPWDVPDENHE